MNRKILNYKLKKIKHKMIHSDQSTNFERDSNSTDDGYSEDTSYSQLCREYGADYKPMFTQEEKKQIMAENYVPEYDSNRIAQVLKESQLVSARIEATIMKIESTQKRVNEVRAGCKDVLKKEKRMR